MAEIFLNPSVSLRQAKQTKKLIESLFLFIFFRENMLIHFQ